MAVRKGKKKKNILKPMCMSMKLFLPICDLEIIMAAYINVALYLQGTLSQLPETVSLHVWPQPGRKKGRSINKYGLGLILWLHISANSVLVAIKRVVISNFTDIVYC